MLYPMTILTGPATHRVGTHRASHVRHPPPEAITVMTVHLLDGGAPGGLLSGAARHVIEAHGALTPAQRLSLTTPADLPRLYTPAEADILATALVSTGAYVVVKIGRASCRARVF